VTDGQTDRRTGQNYDPQDRASIAASRGKNVPKVVGATSTENFLERTTSLMTLNHLRYYLRGVVSSLTGTSGSQQPLHGDGHH